MDYWTYILTPIPNDKLRMVLVVFSVVCHYLPTDDDRIKIRFFWPDLNSYLLAQKVDNNFPSHIFNCYTVIVDINYLSRSTSYVSLFICYDIEFISSFI